MKKNEVLQQIHSGLMDVLAPFGFKYQKKYDSYVREITEGRQRIAFGFWSYPPRYLFSVFAAIRINAVEDIVHRFSGTPPEYRLTTDTTIVLLSYFTDASDDKLPASSLEEIRASLGAIASVLCTRMIPFLDEHQDIHSIDAAMNNSHVDKSHQPWRGIRSLIVAYLAKNPNFDELVQKYLSECAPIEKNKLIDVVEYLRTG